MWILGIVLLGVAFLVYPLLFNPLMLHVDSRENIFLLRWWGLASARLIGGMTNPGIRLWVLGWRKEFRLLELDGEKKEKKKARKKKKTKEEKKWKRPRWLTFRFGLRVLRTFRIRELRLWLDTGDYNRNAQLYPLFYALSRAERSLQVNFHGRNDLVLVLTNRVWDVLWVFLTGFLSPKT